jgi:glycosyltransferase involved in cell wall biosynthesis
VEPYDFVIACYAGDAAIVNDTSRLIFVHDATWRQLLDFYPRYARWRLTHSMIDCGEVLDRTALDNCAQAIYSSHWAATSAQIEYGTPAHKLRVHPFGPNLPIIPTNDELRQAIEKRGNGPCRLIFVGVDWIRKGGDIAIAIASRLNERGIVCELDVVGSDPPTDRPAWVRAHGFLPRKDPLARSKLATLLLDSDFLILPTRADCSPIVLSEAAAFGLPVATTAVGGIPETIGNTGWAKAFPANAHYELFADWIASVYRDRAHYMDLAWLGRREYIDRLNWPDFARTLLSSVSELRRTAGPSAKSAEFSA